MKAVGKRLRCDGCGRLVSEDSKEGKTFKGFYMPPSINPVTKKEDGRFPGIARAGSPDELCQMHSCPGCTPIIKKATGTHNFSELPDGPLKQIVQQLVSGDRLRNLNFS